MHSVSEQNLNMLKKGLVGIAKGIRSKVYMAFLKHNLQTVDTVLMRAKYVIQSVH